MQRSLTTCTKIFRSFCYQNIEIEIKTTRAEKTKNWLLLKIDETFANYEDPVTSGEIYMPVDPQKRCEVLSVCCHFVVVPLVQHNLHLPCGLVVRIRRSHRRGRGSIPRTGAMFCSLLQIYNFTSNETCDPYVLASYFFEFYSLTLNIICRDSKIILKYW